MAEQGNDYILAKNPIELNRADKIKYLSILRISAGLGIFLTLVQAVNIFLINNKANNPITLWWGIITLLLTLLNLVNLIVCLRESRNLSRTDDEYGVQSDNLQNRSLFVLNLFVTFAFIIFFIIYKFAQNELWDHFQMLNQVKFLDGFKVYLADKSAWMNFLSLVNIAIGCHAVITYYGLTASQPAVRFYIFASSVVLLLISFFILNQFNVLKSVYHGKEYIFNFNAWNDRLNWVFAVVAIPLTVLMFLANFKRLKNGVLILGTLLLVLVAIQGSAAGQTFRDYKLVDAHFRPRCGAELAKIHRNYVETFPCQNKYVYENKHQCPQSTNTMTDCLQDPHICDRNLLMRVWEENVTLDKSAPIYGCADERACGALNLIYTSPVLTYATLVLLWCLLAFALAAFSFLLSSKPTGDNLNSGIVTLFFGLLAVAVIIGFFLLGLSSVPQIPKRPAVTEAFNVHETRESSNDFFALSTSKTSLRHNNGESNHNDKHHSVAPQVHNEETRDQDSGDVYQKKDCKKFFNAVYGASGSSSSRLNRYDGSAAQPTNQRDDISSWIPADEKIDPTDNSITNKGYLVCISSYNKPNDKNKPIFLVPEHFEINRNHDVFQLEGYSCAKNVLESKNPTDDNVKYHDDRAYIGFVGTKDAVDLVFKHDLQVCEDNTITGNELNNHKFLILVSEVDLEGHYGDRLLSKEFRKNHVIPDTQYPPAALTADQLQVVRSSFSLRLFNLTVTDAENNRALLPHTEFAIQGATINTGNDHKAKDTCETNFDWAPIKKLMKSQAHTFGYTNDIAQSHIVIVLKGEPKPDPNIPNDVAKNNSPYVGLSTLALKYRLYAWRWVNNKVEYNCREFQVEHNNKVTREEVQLSRILGVDQLRVVLQWRDPTVNLDLLSTFRKKSEWICNVAAFEDRCGRGVHFGETPADAAASTTEVIQFTNPGHFHYAFYVSTLWRNDNMTADAKTFQLKFRDALPVLTYYKYKDGNKYDQIVGVARPFSDFSTFTTCTDDACKFKLPPATYTAKDSNTVDLANIAFCVRGDDKHLPLKIDVISGATQNSNNGFVWNFPNTDALVQPEGSNLDENDFQRSNSQHFMFPVSDICQIQFRDSIEN